MAHDMKLSVLDECVGSVLGGHCRRVPSRGPFRFGGEGGIDSLASRAHPCGAPSASKIAARFCRTGVSSLPSAGNQKWGHKGPIFNFWRRGWDSNPRYGRTVHLISSQAHSTTLAPLLNSAFSFGETPFGRRTPDLTRRFAPRPFGAHFVRLSRNFVALGSSQAH